MPSMFDYLGYAGNALDLPASSLRDLLTGNNPFDQWATPFSDRNRATGRDVLSPFLGANEETGFAGWADNPMEGLKDIAGFGRFAAFAGDGGFDRTLRAAFEDDFIQGFDHDFFRYAVHGEVKMPQRLVFQWFLFFG